MSKHNSPARKLRYLAEYGLFLAAASLIRNTSPKLLFTLSRGLGSFLFHLLGKRRHIARTNLDIAFGNDKTPKEKDAIIKASFSQTVLSALQCIWVSVDTKNRVSRLMVSEPEGLEHLEACIQSGKGFFALMAHYGNWEILGIYHGYHGTTEHYSIARKLDNPYLEKFFMELRTISGNQILHKDESPLKIVRALKKGGSVAVMMDQNGGIGGLFVDFFGKKAATPRAMASLSYGTGARILPVICEPVAGGKYKIVYQPSLKLEKTDDKEADIFQWTQQCEKTLEDIIRRHPEPWMWFHRRWKSRPPEERGQEIY